MSRLVKPLPIVSSLQPARQLSLLFLGALYLGPGLKTRRKVFLLWRVGEYQIEEERMVASIESPPIGGHLVRHLLLQPFRDGYRSTTHSLGGVPYPASSAVNEKPLEYQSSPDKMRAYLWDGEHCVSCAADGDGARSRVVAPHTRLS